MQGKGPGVRFAEESYDKRKPIVLYKEKGWRNLRWCFSQDGTHEKTEEQKLTWRNPSGTGNWLWKFSVSTMYLTLASRVWKLLPYAGCWLACVEWFQSSWFPSQKRGESITEVTLTRGSSDGSLRAHGLGNSLTTCHSAGHWGVRRSAETVLPTIESSSCFFLTRNFKYPQVSLGHFEFLFHILKELFHFYYRYY